LPTLRWVEDFDIEDLLGADLLEQLREGLASGLPPTPATQELLRPVLAHRAIAQGVFSLSVALTGASLRLLSDNEAVRQRQAAGPEVLSALSQQHHNYADNYQAKLATFLDELRPTAAPVLATLYDNSHSPSFVV